MKFTGLLSKMDTELQNPVQYTLKLEENIISVNKLIGSTVKIEWTGEIFCLKCGKKTKSSFFQGFCYNCFSTAPEAAPCILNPELCEAHLGIYRDKKYAEDNCLSPHFVYIAHSGGIKVGVTRFSQISTRWIDQGADRALKIAETPNRYLAGMIETDLKQYFSDKTNFRKMLSNVFDQKTELEALAKNAVELVNPHYKQYMLSETKAVEIFYPVEKYPDMISSINLENTPEINEKLIGIRAQYLIFESNKVINIRKYGGYRVSLSY